MHTLSTPQQYVICVTDKWIRSVITDIGTGNENILMSSEEKYITNVILKFSSCMSIGLDLLYPYARQK